MPIATIGLGVSAPASASELVQHPMRSIKPCKRTSASPKTCRPRAAVSEGVQLAVYLLIFEGVKYDLWEFKDKAAGEAFMLELESSVKLRSFRPALRMSRKRANGRYQFAS